MPLGSGGAVTLKTHIQPLLKEYCYSCHDSKKQKGDLDLEPVGGNPKFAENRVVWEKVAEMIESGEMPPEKKPQLRPEQRDSLLHFIEGQLSSLEGSGGAQSPGRVTLRRLNRDEYHNTIRDLLAAEEIVRRAIVVETNAKPTVKKLKGASFLSPSESVNPLEKGGLAFYSQGEAVLEFAFARKGEYIFRIRTHGDQAGPEPAKLVLKVGGSRGMRLLPQADGSARVCPGAF